MKYTDFVEKYHPKVASQYRQELLKRYSRNKNRRLRRGDRNNAAVKINAPKASLGKLLKQVKKLESA